MFDDERARRGDVVWDARYQFGLVMADAECFVRCVNGLAFWILVTQQIKSLDLQQGNLVGKLGRRLPPSGATTVQISVNGNVKMWLRKVRLSPLSAAP